MSPEMIRETTGAVKELSALGSDGFVLFAIFVVMVMFLLMGFIAYKSQKTMINTLRSKHDENAEAIAHAHERIHEMELRENECIRRLDTATRKLEECMESLRGVADA